MREWRYGLSIAMPDNTVLHYRDLSQDEAREICRRADLDDLAYNLGVDRDATYGCDATCTTDCGHCKGGIHNSK